MRYSIELAPTGLRSLRAIRDRKIRREVAKDIDGLAVAPQNQGKALVGPLEGVRSIRSARGRFRILFKVDPEARKVFVLLVGRRQAGQENDIYAVARRLLKTLMGGEED